MTIEKHKIDYKFRRSQMPEKNLMHLKYDIQKGEPPASELVLISMGSYYLISHRHTQIDHRGQGLGSKLLDEAKKENTELRIETSQLEVINWALKNGFNSEVIIPNQENLTSLGLKEVQIYMPNTDEQTSILINTESEISRTPTEAELNEKAYRITLSWIPQTKQEQLESEVTKKTQSTLQEISDEL